jgi:hypothetical protein
MTTPDENPQMATPDDNLDDKPEDNLRWQPQMTISFQ